MKHSIMLRDAALQDLVSNMKYEADTDSEEEGQDPPAVGMKEQGASESSKDHSLLRHEIEQLKHFMEEVNEIDDSDDAECLESSPKEPTQTSETQPAETHALLGTNEVLVVRRRRAVVPAPEADAECSADTSLLQEPQNASVADGMSGNQRCRRTRQQISDDKVRVEEEMAKAQAAVSAFVSRREMEAPGDSKAKGSLECILQKAEEARGPAEVLEVAEADEGENEVPTQQRQSDAETKTEEGAADARPAKRSRQSQGSTSSASGKKGKKQAEQGERPAAKAKSKAKAKAKSKAKSESDSAGQAMPGQELLANLQNAQLLAPPSDKKMKPKSAAKAKAVPKSTAQESSEDEDVADDEELPSDSSEGKGDQVPQPKRRRGAQAEPAEASVRDTERAEEVGKCQRPGPAQLAKPLQEPLVLERATFAARYPGKNRQRWDLMKNTFAEVWKASSFSRTKEGHGIT